MLFVLLGAEVKMIVDIAPCGVEKRWENPRMGYLINRY